MVRLDTNRKDPVWNDKGNWGGGSGPTRSGIQNSLKVRGSLSPSVTEWL